MKDNDRVDIDVKLAVFERHCALLLNVLPQHIREVVEESTKRKDPTSFRVPPFYPIGVVQGWVFVSRKF